MGSIGPTELLVIGLIVLLIFGAGRIADVGKGLGEGIRNFKKGLKDDSSDKPALPANNTTSNNTTLARGNDDKRDEQHVETPESQAR